MGKSMLEWPHPKVGRRGFCAKPDRGAQPDERTLPSTNLSNINYQTAWGVVRLKRQLHC